MSLKTDHVLLREFPFAYAGDSSGLASMHQDDTADSTNDRMARAVLLSGAETIDSKMLSILIEETGLSEQEVQRIAPRLMVLEVTDGSRIYVETDCPVPRISTAESIREVIGRFRNLLSGRPSVHLRMAVDDAMSLYGAASQPIAFDVQ